MSVAISEPERTAPPAVPPGGSALAPRAIAARLGMCAIGAAAFSLYFFTQKLDPGARHTLATPLDATVPFAPSWEWIYASIYLAAFLPALQMRDLRLLARALVGLIAVQIAANGIFLAFPVRMVRPEALVDPHRSFLEWGLALNFVLDPPVNCFPSLHVANAFYVCLCAWSVDRAVGGAALSLAGLIALSTMFVKQHWFLDVVGGTMLAIVVWRALFHRHVPESAPREHLVLPRRVLLLIPGAFAAIVGALFALWMHGMTFPYPPAGS
jgi:membrane-associated phospholipid phosphatase